MGSHFIPSPLPFDHFRKMPNASPAEVAKELAANRLSASVYPLGGTGLSNHKAAILTRSHYFRSILDRRNDLMTLTPVLSFGPASTLPSLSSPSSPDRNDQIEAVVHILLRMSGRADLQLHFLDLGDRCHISFQQDKSVYVSHLLLNPDFVAQNDPGIKGAPHVICAIKIFSTIIQLDDLKDLPQLFSEIFASGMVINTTTS